MPRFALFALAPLLIAGMAGCAPQGSFPSLAPRAVEKADLNPPAPPPPPTVASDPALAARLAQLVDQARQGDAAFEAELPKARAAVEKAGAAGSDSWVVAQEAVSGLEAARAPTAAALTELDRLGVERGVAGTPTSASDQAAIAGAIETLRTMAQKQKEEIDRLAGRLSPL